MSCVCEDDVEDRDHIASGYVDISELSKRLYDHDPDALRSLLRSGLTLAGLKATGISDNRSTHLAHWKGHRPTSFEFRGKQDSIDVYCPCGEQEVFALWWMDPPEGWDIPNFMSFRMAVIAFCEYIKFSLQGG